MFLTATQPSHWRSEIFDLIITHLEKEEKFLLIRASKSLSREMWKRAPSLRSKLTEAAQIETLNLFYRPWADAPSKRVPLLRSRLTKAAQIENPDLSYTSGANDPSALLGSPLVLQITSIANTDIRRKALQFWVNDQGVCIDQGGFYVQKRRNTDFGDCAYLRVRIGLWDCPFEDGDRFHGNRLNDFESIRRLKAEFYDKGYA
jgi:hypothetical protein